MKYVCISQKLPFERIIKQLLLYINTVNDSGRGSKGHVKIGPDQQHTYTKAVGK
jgi:hypothetical protein